MSPTPFQIEQANAQIEHAKAIQLERAKLSPNRTPLTVVNRDLGLLTSNRTKVCILGAACTQYPLLPDDTAWEVWSCNALWRLGFDRLGHFRADRWFEMHPYEAQSVQDRVMLHAAPVDVYVLSPEDHWWVPRYVTYPLKDVCRTFPGIGFASTFAYQVALALYLGMQTIQIEGVSMGAGREALVERPNLLYWLGLASGHGVKVQIHESPGYGRPLLSLPYRYGYDYHAEKEEAEEYCREVLDSIARDGWRGSR